MTKLVGTLGFELFDPQLPSGKRGAVVVEPSPTLAFVLDYPMEIPFEFRRTYDDGSDWTRQQFLEAIVEAYRDVYLHADRHGVWGHDMEDPVVEDAKRLEDGSWRLFVGS